MSGKVTKDSFNNALGIGEVDDSIKINKNDTNVSSDFLGEITKETVLAFLNCPDTKVRIQKQKTGETVIIATNNVAGESIVIKNLGDIYVAYTKVLKWADKYKTEIKAYNETHSGQKPTLISKNLIKIINGIIQMRKYKFGEVGIGAIRRSDRAGRPVKVRIAEEVDDKVIQTIFPVEQPNDNCRDNKNVVRKLKELVDWTNDSMPNAKSEEELLLDIAEFHARFIQIHPFRDGNGRTARLLNNYFMSAVGNKLISIREEDRQEYLMALDYALRPSDNAFINQGKEFKEYFDTANKIKMTESEKLKSNYMPLKRLFEKRVVEDSKDSSLIGSVIKDKTNQSLSAEKVDFKE